MVYWESLTDVRDIAIALALLIGTELLPAVGFAVVVALLALAVRWAEVRYGDAGVAVLLAITGLRQRV